MISRSDEPHPEAPVNVRTDRFAHLELVIDRELQWPIDLQEEIDLLHRWELPRLPQEVVWVIAYDPQMHVRTVIEVARGGVQEVSVHLPTMLGAILATGCDRFIVAHNHPSGDPTPSLADGRLALAICNAANICGLYLDDFVIVAHKERHVSFAEQGWHQPAQYGGSNVSYAGATRVKVPKAR
jgi:DNA repair protein RadC